MRPALVAQRIVGPVEELRLQLEDILQDLKGAKRTVVLADYGMRDMHRGCNLIQLD